MDKGIRSIPGITAAIAQDVLLVEAGNPNRAMYGEYLAGTGYRLEICRHRVDALNSISRIRPAAILLELNASDALGMAILRQITAKYSQCVLIVITSDASLSQAIDGMRSGAADYVVKPFSAERLVITLWSALERRQLKRQVRELESKKAGPKCPSPVEAENRQTGAIRPLREVERDTIQRAVEHCGGNIAKAAAFLEISPTTIYRKMMSW